VSKKTVLVTGATGIIGRIVTEDLAGRYAFTKASRREIAGEGWVKIDIASEYGRFAELVAAHDAVVHLAYAEEDDATTANLAMTKNVYRAVHAAEPHPRLVMASSVHAVNRAIDWSAEPYASIARRAFDAVKERPPLVGVDAPLSPDAPYAALKGYIELLGRAYSYRGVEMVVVRYGGVRLDDVIPDEPGYHCFFLSRRDCAHVVERAIEADLAEPYNLVFATSRNTWAVYDISDAVTRLGYAPRDDAEDFVGRRPK